VTPCREHSIAIEDESLIHLSPVGWEHVKPTRGRLRDGSGSEGSGRYGPSHHCTTSPLDIAQAIELAAGRKAVDSLRISIAPQFAALSARPSMGREVAIKTRSALRRGFVDEGYPRSVGQR
jgi:hypothetical protein